MGVCWVRAQRNEPKGGREEGGREERAAWGPLVLIEEDRQDRNENREMKTDLLGGNEKGVNEMQLRGDEVRREREREKANTSDTPKEASKIIKDIAENILDKHYNTLM